MRADRQTTVRVRADDLTSAADGGGPFVMRGGPASFCRGDLAQRNTPVVAIDSGTRSVAARPRTESIRWVGSAGLACALARRLAPIAGAFAAIGAAPGEILVVGTANPRSYRQAIELDPTADVTVLRSPNERAVAQLRQSDNSAPQEKP